MSKKIDLSILKRLVSELEAAVASAEEIVSTNEAMTPEINQNYIVALAKATGLSAHVSQEAALLTGDINQIVAQSTTDVAKSTEFLDQFFKFSKGDAN